VLQCVAVCCSVLQCAAVCGSVWGHEMQTEYVYHRVCIPFVSKAFRHRRTFPWSQLSKNLCVIVQYIYVY